MEVTGQLQAPTALPPIPIGRRLTRFKFISSSAIVTSTLHSTKTNNISKVCNYCYKSLWCEYLSSFAIRQVFPRFLKVHLRIRVGLTDIPNFSPYTTERLISLNASSRCVVLTALEQRRVKI